MAVGYLQPVEYWGYGRIVVGDNEYRDTFGPDHPARTAFNVDPTSYWRSGKFGISTEEGEYGGTVFCVAPADADLTKPVTLRYYARNLQSVGTEPVDTFSISAFFADAGSVDTELEPIGGGTYLATATGTPSPGTAPRGSPYDIWVSVANPQSEDELITLEVFSVEVEYTRLPWGGNYRLRQRQTLPGADSWPLRQRHNGSHTGSWPLRQRQTGI